MRLFTIYRIVRKRGADRKLRIGGHTASGETGVVSGVRNHTLPVIHHTLPYKGDVASGHVTPAACSMGEFGTLPWYTRRVARAKARVCRPMSASSRDVSLDVML